MTEINEKNTEAEAILDSEGIEYKIEIATQTLERNIGFITSCDTKTSIILATVGVLFTIILTNEGLKEIFHIVKTCIEAKNLCGICYLLCFIVVTLILTVGVFNLLSVLVARTSKKVIGRKDAKSRIFFIGIIKSGNYKTYRQRFYTMSKEELLNDLIEEIYINASIASTKYAMYNLGLRYTIIGFILFIVFLFAGIYIY